MKHLLICLFLLAGLNSTSFSQALTALDGNTYRGPLIIVCEEPIDPNTCSGYVTMMTLSFKTESVDITEQTERCGSRTSRNHYENAWSRHDNTVTIANRKRPDAPLVLQISDDALTGEYEGRHLVFQKDLGQPTK